MKHVIRWITRLIWHKFRYNLNIYIYTYYNIHRRITPHDDVNVKPNIYTHGDEPHYGFYGLACLILYICFLLSAPTRCRKMGMGGWLIHIARLLVTRPQACVVVGCTHVPLSKSLGGDYMMGPTPLGFLVGSISMWICLWAPHYTIYIYI